METNQQELETQVVTQESKTVESEVTMKEEER